MRPWTVTALAFLPLVSLTATSCATEPTTAGTNKATEQASVESATEAAVAGEEPPDFGPRPERAAIAFGSVSARIPGTSTIVSSVRLVSHRVSATVQDGFARTEIEEEIVNDGDVALEAKLAFSIPEGAVLTRLGLWVGPTVVEAEIEEKRRIAGIFKGIVDEPVRPKDPALLEHVAGSRYSLKIFPVPAKGRRRAVFAYDQALPSSGNLTTYRLPLGAGEARATHLDTLAVSVRVRGLPATTAAGTSKSRIETQGWDASAEPTPSEGNAHTIAFERHDVTPADDLIVRISDDVGAPRTGGVRTARYVPKESETKGSPEAGYVALRITPPPPDAAPSSVAPPPRIAIVVDTSHGQSTESLRATRERLFKALGTLGAATDVRVLACDSACETAPLEGARPSRRALDAWLATRSPRGSADVGGALAAGLRALEGTKRSVVLYVGEAAATAGELAADRLVTRLGTRVRDDQVDVLFFGEGRGVDDAMIDRLAHGLGGARLSEAELVSLGTFFAAPRIRDLSVALPSGISAVPGGFPTQARIGESFVVLAREGTAVSGELVLTGKVNGADYRQALSIDATDGAPPNPLLPKLWAKARLDELEATGDPATIAEAVALSKRAHVLSRHTSLVALENDAMFAAYGVARTTRDASDQADAAFGASPVAGLGSVGTLGHGSGTADQAGGSGAVGHMWGSGFGAGHVGGSHHTKGPVVRMGAIQVAGRLPPEIIQRIVRQSFGRFRLCYENGLRASPGLGGTVRVRFAIQPDGSVGAVVAGGDMPSAEVRSCIGSAFRRLAFPAPEGGMVQVTYPITFFDEGNPNGAVRSERSLPEYPTMPLGVSHTAGTEAWTQGSEDALAKLREAAKQAGNKRGPREQLVRGLVLHGRFDESLAAARELVAADPDSALAWSLLAESSLLAGATADALGAVDTVAALDPSAVGPHLQAGNAFHEAGDDARSCAHFRALVTLPEVPDAALAEAIRCRALVLGERDLAIAEGKRFAKPGPQLSSMIHALEGGASPAFQSPSPLGAVTASLACQSDCPRLALITPRGRVVSALTPGVSRSTGTVLSAGRQGGVYRTLALGPRATATTVTLRADDVSQVFPIAVDGSRTVATSVVQNDGLARFGWGFGR